MAHWLLATAVLLLYMTRRGSYSAVTTTCDTEFRACEKSYNDQTVSILLLNATNSSDALCQVATQTLFCLSLLTCPVPALPLTSERLFRISVLDAQSKYCSSIDAPTTPSPFLPAVPITPSCVPSGLVPANGTAQSADLAQPNIQSNAAVDASCIRSSSKTLLHCSAFGYSHLRAFAASNIQTCLLPGSWYLFKHQLLTVEVSTVADMGIEVPYTRITKINVTLSQHACSKQRSYIATANSSLPRSFSDGLSALGVLTFSDPTTVKLSVPWINTTIILRSDQGLLAISMQAPLDVLAQSQGMCMDGCSLHTRLSITPYVSKWVNNCVAASNQALMACVLHSNMFNTFLDISNDSYILVCQFELLMTSSNSTLKLMRAVASDAMLLPNTERILLPGKISLSTYLATDDTSSPSDGTMGAQSSSPTSTTNRRVETHLTSSGSSYVPYIPSLSLAMLHFLLRR